MTSYFHFSNYNMVINCQVSWNISQQLLTWNKDRAWESNDPASVAEARLPWRSLHFISGFPLQTEPFLPYLFFIILKTSSGSSSSRQTTIFRKEELMSLQSRQQNHFPLGTAYSCMRNINIFNPKKWVPMNFNLKDIVYARRLCSNK